jgi:YYY domain-containing protein
MAALSFWFAAMVVAALAMPIALLFFRRLPDGGAGLTFGLGTVVAGYLYFILRTLSVLPAGRGGFVLAVGLLGLVSAASIARNPRFRRDMGRCWPGMLLVAGAFTFLFFGYVSFRSYQPDIAGTEQPMDLMYLNAALHSPKYPPEDPWLAGERASYYYFGYVQGALLTAVSGVRASVGYNLNLAFLFAAAGVGVGSVAGGVGRWVLPRAARRWSLAAGGLAVVLLLFAGSLSGVFEVAAAHEKYDAGLYRAVGLEHLLPCSEVTEGDCYGGPSPRTDAWYPTEFWWWFRASRVIPQTITEFPFFSFLLGDMHPHVMSIPLVLLVLGLAAAAWRGRSALDHRSLLGKPLEAAVLATILGGLAFQNAWDVLTFAGLFFLAVLLRNLRRGPPKAAVVSTAGYAVPLAVGALVLYWPWLRDFSSQAEGLRPYVDEGTRPVHLFLQYGPLLVAAALALVWSARRSDFRPAAKVAPYTAWVWALPLFAWAALAEGYGSFGEAAEARTAGGWVTLAILAGLVWALVTGFVVLAAARRPAAWALGLSAVGVLLLYGAELLFIKDIFFGGFPRMNTVFKLSYQAWTLLSLAGAVGLALAVHRLRAREGPAFGLAPVAGLLVLGALVYAVAAVPGRTNGFEAEPRIDGIEFVRLSNVAEYEITLWVAEHVPPGARIIEGSGRTWRQGADGQPALVRSDSSYTEAGRIAARTGRPTLIGWYGHEAQWRGATPANYAEFTRRQDLIDSIYLAGSADEAIARMREAGAEYLVMGILERDRYPSQFMPDFASFMDVVYEQNIYAVYRLPSAEVVRTS